MTAIVPVPTELPPWVWEILNTLIAPAAEETGQLGRDLVKYVRARVQIRYFLKLKRTCEEAALSLQHVNLPLLADILQRGTIEEDENLQTLWVNLLANAADSRRQVLIRTAFPQILREISSNEARYLVEMFEVSNKTTAFVPEMYAEDEDSDKEPQRKLDPVSYDNLLRLRLIQPNDGMIPVESLGVGQNQYKLLTGEEFTVSALGKAFVIACSAPTKA